MKMRLACLALAVAFGATTCGCTPGYRTGEGAVIGAAGGGIAALAGASPWWILGGAVIGAVAGNAIDAHEAHCHHVHYRCAHCHTVYCNSPYGCPHCHSTEVHVYHHDD